MKHIYKYVLTPDRTQKHYAVGNVPLPIGSRVLHIDVQNAKICVWAEVDDQAIMGDGMLYGEWFAVLGTGMEPPDDDWEYKTTVSVDIYVLHIYQKKAKQSLSR